MVPSDIHSLGLIVIRQKLYTKPATSGDIPATAVIEDRFLRKKDNSVTPKEINIYRPKEQISRGTHLRYLMSGLVDFMTWGIHPENSGSTKSQINDHTWVSPNACDDSAPLPIDNTATPGALSSTSPCTASTQSLMNYLPSRLDPTPYTPPLHVRLGRIQPVFTGLSGYRCQKPSLRSAPRTRPAYHESRWHSHTFMDIFTYDRK